VNPVGPVGPVKPVGPVNPVGPVKPVGPVGPVQPAIPETETLQVPVCTPTKVLYVTEIVMSVPEFCDVMVPSKNTVELVDTRTV
jgi:hypothetical protein